MRDRFLENKIFILILFLMFVMWSTFIIFFIWLDGRTTKIENKMEVIYEEY